MSYLVTEFYKNDIPDVIICVCQILTPVVVLPEADNWPREKRRRGGKDIHMERKKQNDNPGQKMTAMFLLFELWFWYAYNAK